MFDKEEDAPDRVQRETQQEYLGLGPQRYPGLRPETVDEWRWRIERQQAQRTQEEQDRRLYEALQKMQQAQAQIPTQRRVFNATDVYWNDRGLFIETMVNGVSTMVKIPEDLLQRLLTLSAMAGLEKIVPAAPASTGTASE